MAKILLNFLPDFSLIHGIYSNINGKKCYCNLMRRMKNRHFYLMILLIQISAVGLILQETPTNLNRWNLIKCSICP